VTFNGDAPGSSQCDRCGLQRAAKTDRNTFVNARTARSRSSSGTVRSDNANMQSLAPFDTKYQNPCPSCASSYRANIPTGSSKSRVTYATVTAGGPAQNGASTSAHHCGPPTG
jgi:hypothetical protein